MARRARGKPARKATKRKRPRTSSGTAATTPPPPLPPAIDLKGWREVNRIQMAELLGVHPDTVTDYTRQGMPVVTMGGHGKEAVYDAVVCLAWWRERQGKNAKEAAQTRAYEATAALNELKLQRESGEVLSRHVVELEGQQYTKAWATQVRALPRRLARNGLIRREDLPSVIAICRELLMEIARWKTPGDLKRAAEDAA